MRSGTVIFSRDAFCAAIAGTLALSLAACDQQQKAPPTKFGQSFEMAPEKSADKSADKPAASNAAPQTGSAAVDIPDPADAALASRIKTAIAAEPALKSVTVDVNVANGVVTLNGTADTPVNSDRAAKIALNVDGVRSVKNDLIVVRGS